ncbi:MAG: hypothetical protein ABSC23_12785 [Bryobacteraceae bacterium]
MKSFRFRLDKVLDWRRTQLELEEDKFKQECAAVAELDRLRAAWEASGIKAEMQIRQWGQVTGGDLAALGAFRQRVKTQETEIAARRAGRLQTLAAREAAMMEARRRCRLLERLKERRRGEWQAGETRETEELAAESYLARWNRAREE